MSVQQSTKNLLVISILFFVSNSLACYPAKISLQKRFESAKNIYVGVVSKIEIKKQDINSNHSISSISPETPPSLLLVTVSEVLKGTNNNEHIHPQILNCGSGKANLDDQVIVFYTEGFWYTMKYEKEDYLKLMHFAKDEIRSE